MTAKTIKIAYWTLISLFILFTLFDAYGGITQMPQGQDMLKHLGYPMYLLTMSGVAKLFGAAALLQNKFKALKEWAFAGFFIEFIFAIWSHAAVGDGGADTAMPLVFLVYLFVTYYFWKRYNAVSAQG